MNDYLQNATVRNLLKTLNIPVPVPPILKRNLNAFSEAELQAKKVAVAGSESDFLHQIQHTLHGKTAAATIYDAAIDGLVVSCVCLNSSAVSDFLLEFSISWVSSLVSLAKLITKFNGLRNSCARPTDMRPSDAIFSVWIS